MKFKKKWARAFGWVFFWYVSFNFNIECCILSYKLYCDCTFTFSKLFLCLFSLQCLVSKQILAILVHFLMVRRADAKSWMIVCLMVEWPGETYGPIISGLVIWSGVTSPEILRMFMSAAGNRRLWQRNVRIWGLKKVWLHSLMKCHLVVFESELTD